MRGPGDYHHIELSVTVTGAEGTARADATTTVTVGGVTTFEIRSGNTLLADAPPSILDDRQRGLAGSQLEPEQRRTL